MYHVSHCRGVVRTKSCIIIIIIIIIIVIISISLSIIDTYNDDTLPQYVVHPQLPNC